MYNIYLKTYDMEWRPPYHKFLNKYIIHISFLIEFYRGTTGWLQFAEEYLILMKTTEDYWRFQAITSRFYVITNDFMRLHK